MSFKYPRDIRFRCERCALCCGDHEDRVRRILLLDTEAVQISVKTSKSIGEFAEENKGPEPYVYVMKKDHGECLFLRDGSCLIYNIRPLVCRFYPFRLEALGEERYAFHFTEECPGIGKGPQLTEGYFRKLFSQFLHACTRCS